MAKNMESAVKISFPCASLVTDRFHVVKLAVDALKKGAFDYIIKEITLCLEQFT